MSASQTVTTPTVGNLNTNALVPGYTKQGFSYARSAIFGFAEGKDIWIGRGAILLSKASEYIEIPFRLVEDAALIAINALGSFFNEGCSKNLNGHLTNCVLSDIKDVAIVWLLSWSTMIKVFTVIYHLSSIFDSKGHDFGNLKKEQLEAYYEMGVIRKHGYNNIQKLKESKLDIPAPEGYYQKLASATQAEFEALLLAAQNKLATDAAERRAKLEEQKA